MRKFVHVIAVVFYLTAASTALAWDAVVVRVVDGDTVVVTNEASGEQVRIRLYGIDAPEGHGKKWEPQPYSRKASDRLKEILPEGSLCAVVDMGYDKYDRTVAGIVALPDGTVVQEAMLQEGLAWVYPKYCKDCRQWKEMQDNAREKHIGLWRAKKPVPPWEWRNGGK